MTYPAGKLKASKVYVQSQDLLFQGKNTIDKALTSIATGSILYNDVLDVHRTVKAMKEKLQDVKRTKGINKYAKDEEDNPALVIKDEATALIDLITPANQWIGINVKGAIIDRENVRQNGDVDPATILQADLAGLVPLLTAITDFIDITDPV